ncbi:hypothetical protein Kpol_1042p25 [Vanderwaltozyma polyspora DSM 70294]|uniref:Splicing factor YJU2 n=1 Tax=Vanderwaltozyma polyspora (strain ATCC 22028 / DSM 70294 / BCRC 21397 / CBS 2163 / NBRC 10782 / NRRL Y-8283 / UCD 57-17) TaxID=436907 RepID=A7TQB0_VANPO|nr:uncharacterized protein Kpol_1042p25 [Vanderwaltozyma polyspora DSM 70294]EDO15564.1 hypothetical protein Kpol_1042p25 [Vanderwaltozyma polyspora DSM 70294]
MSERKAINKYYPPDYNPLEAEKAAKKLSKRLKTTNKDVVTIRLMTPFGMRCLKCDEYISKSRKFNGKKQLLPEKYLDSIKIYRLSIKCPRCNNLISFRTDPKKADYVMEVGGERSYIRKDYDSAQLESVDEALERLTKEQEREKSELEGKLDPTADKMELLEEKLATLQQQQQDDESLENLKKLKYASLKKAEELNQKLDLNKGTKGANNGIEDDDMELNSQVESAFKEHQQNSTSSILNQLITNKSIPIKKKLKRKKQNPLGVSVRKK